MSQQKKESWDCDSVDAGLLFLLFHKRIFHPDSFSASGIYEHPDLRSIWSKYSKKGFNRYCQTQANREVRYRKKGVWSNKKFKNAVAKAANETYKKLLDSLQPWKDLEEGAEEEDDEYLTTIPRKSSKVTEHERQSWKIYSKKNVNIVFN